MSGDDSIRIMCWPRSALGKVNKGSVIRHCVECLGEVTVAPSSFKFIKRRNIRKPLFTCVPCCDRLIRREKGSGKPLEILPLQPEQVEEIARELNQEKN